MPKRLLLADDSVTIQKVVGISFANEDVELVTVDNGDEALSRVRETRPHLVLADVVMPGKNGYEVCEAIKSDPDLRHIPVLLLTGTFEAFDEERARSAGADGHITKPFEAQTLVDRVNQLMREAPPAARAAPSTGSSSAGVDSGEPWDFFDDQEEASEQGPDVQLDAPADLEAASEADAFVFEAEESGSEDPTPSLLRDDPLAQRAGPAPRSEPSPSSRTAAPSWVPEGDGSATVVMQDDSLLGEDDLTHLGLDDARDPGVALEPDEDLEEAEAPEEAFEAVEDLPDEELSASGDRIWDSAAESQPDAFPAAAPGLEIEAEDDGIQAGDDLEFGLYTGEADDDPGAPLPASTSDFDVSSSDLGDPLAGPVAGPAAIPAPAEPTPDATSPPNADELRARIADMLERIAWEALGDLSEQLVKQTVARVEEIAWEVIPQMAESLICEEIRRLKEED